MTAAPEQELALLCQSCGLCCDGALFGRVPLEPPEVEGARAHRLRVLPDGRAFDQPCRALRALDAGHDGRRACAIYDDRPAACRRFVCRTYDRQRREGGPLEPRLAAVRRVRVLLERVRSQGARAEATVSELRERLEEDFARV